MNVKSLTTRYLITGIILFSLCQLSYPQFVDFNTIQKSGTVLINAHMDDDLIWMLPFWDISEKFILGAMPRTPVYEAIVHGQQGLIDGLGYNIDYEANWITPWGGITAEEYHEYYDLGNLNYSYLANDHLIAFWNLTQDTETDRKEINRIKSKLEQYIASPDLSRIITHNNWGEYGNQHHKALNKAVRELAVKYRKDVWMLGCDNGTFIDVDVPDGIKYTLASFDDPALYTGIRSIYYNYEWHWTWDDYLIPSGNHKFIKIVEAGIDKSDILPPVQEVDVPGPLQEEPGAYIFDGEDDYMTLTGNNFSSFTIAMRVRPDQISSMDIAKMAEFPYYGSNDYFQPLPSLFDRSFYLQNDGRVNARIFDGSSKIASSTTALTSGNWAHLAMTSDGSNLKIYINGIPENTVSAGTAITGYASPVLVLEQAQ